MFDFNETLERRGTNSVKWDSIAKTYGEQNLWPMWIADMDFKTTPEVTAALSDFAGKSVFGYQMVPDSFYEAISTWQKEHHDYEISQESTLLFSSVLAGLATAVQTFTKKDDAILIHDPVYPPFARIVELNQRQLVRSPLIEANGHFEMDFADIEDKFKNSDIKLMILCNPHNPGGRVWTKSELLRLGELCKKYDVLVLSDEIHQDLVFPPHEMTTFHQVADDFSDFSVAFTSVTKTFNLAGVKISFAFAKNARLRNKLELQQFKTFGQEINSFGLIAAETAYQTGEPWRQELLTYLQDNIDFTLSYIKEHLPKVNVTIPEATYLIWLDFSEYGLEDGALMDKLIHDGKVVLNPGIDYGPHGSQHLRLNIACSRETLQTGLTKITAVFGE